MIQTGSKNGEIRYFIFYTDYDYEITFLKVQCMRFREDKVNNCWVYDCKVLENIFDENGYKGTTTIVDHEWQLLRTKREAIKMLIKLVFSHGQHLSYNHQVPVF